VNDICHMSSSFLFDLFLFVCAVIEVPARGYIWCYVLLDAVDIALSYQYSILNIACSFLLLLAAFYMYFACLRADVAGRALQSKWFREE